MLNSGSFLNKKTGRNTLGCSGRFRLVLPLKLEQHPEIQTLEPNIPRAGGARGRLIAGNGHVRPPNEVVADKGIQVVRDLVTQAHASPGITDTRVRLVVVRGVEER